MAEPFREAVRIVIERMRNDPDAFVHGRFRWLHVLMHCPTSSGGVEAFWGAFTSAEALALKEELKLLDYSEFNKRVLATVFQEDRCEDSND
jgi:hypothetical protein